MKRVLITEDNLALAMEWAAAFELNQCSVTLSHNVEDTLLFLNSEPYDLLVTDLFLEDEESGLHLLRRLAETSNSKLPTIAVTGAVIPNSRDTDKNMFLESARILGATTAIQKPFPAGELVAMAQSLWDEKDTKPKAKIY